MYISEFKALPYYFSYKIIVIKIMFKTILFSVHLSIQLNTTSRFKSKSKEEGNMNLFRQKEGKCYWKQQIVTDGTIDDERVLNINIINELFYIFS